MTLPRITVVTPCLNQVDFIEETIASVIGQGYPNLEYIVLDGGSTDGTADIIRNHADELSFWRSEPDGGQANAINAGFAMSTGDILCWLNSDDYLLPGTLAFVSKQLEVNSVSALFGNCFHFTEGSAKSAGSDVVKAASTCDLRYVDYVIQPSAFWTKRLWDAVGELDRSLTYAFDWEWFIRAGRVADCRVIHRYLAAYRFHENHKTSTGQGARHNEILEVYRRVLGESALAAIDGLQKHDRMIQFIETQMCRWRLARLRPKLLRLLYPGVFKQFSMGEINQIRSMLAD